MFIRCGFVGVGFVHVLPRSSDQHTYKGRYSADSAHTEFA